MANCPQFINFYFTEIMFPVAPTDTTITVASVSYLPTLVTGGNFIYLNLIDANSWNNNSIPPATYEIVKVTAISGPDSSGNYTLTVDRGQDHTSPQSFSQCDIASFILNAASLYDLEACATGT